MPDGPRGDDRDRFGDFGRGAPDSGSGGENGGRTPGGRGSAAERLAERDELDAAQEASKRPGPPKPSSRYAWVVGIVFVMVGGVALFNLIANNNAGKALKGPEPGTLLPQFAVPLAGGDVEGDANVRQPGSGDENAGKIPACRVRTNGVLNSCALYERRPLALSVLFDRGASCEPQIDRIERVKGEFPDVNFATVYFSRKDRDEVAEIVRRRGWRQPVGVDNDGEVTNVLGVGGCPITIFVRRGGRVFRSRIGERTDDQLRADVRDLKRVSAAPPARPRR